MRAATNQHIRLTPDVEALVVPGPPTAARPRLRLDTPMVGVGSVPGTGSTAAPAVGSFDWLTDDDEHWAFDAADGLLLLVNLTVPEANRESMPACIDGKAIPTTTGTLRLPVLKDFGRAPAVERWCDPAGTELCGFYTADASRPVGGAVPQRLAIAEGTHLLTMDSVLIGWSIADPARFIIGAAVPSHCHVTRPDVRLPALLAEFFHLVTVENVDRLEDGDRSLKSEMEQLADRLQVVGDGGEPRALEIRNKLRQVLEDFA